MCNNFEIMWWLLSLLLCEFHQSRDYACVVFFVLTLHPHYLLHLMQNIYFGTNEWMNETRSPPPPPLSWFRFSYESCDISLFQKLCCSFLIEGWSWNSLMWSFKASSNLPQCPSPACSSWTSGHGTWSHMFLNTLSLLPLYTFTQAAPPFWIPRIH